MPAERLIFAFALFACAGGLAFVLTGAQIRLAPRLRMIAAPRADRWHARPTATSGGVAVFLAMAAMYLACFRGERAAVAWGAAALWLLGLADDRLRLRPGVKLLGQCIVAGCVVASGVVFHATPSALFNTAFSFLWLVGIPNAFNLIDNMDGLCAGVTCIIGGFRFVLLAWSGDWIDADLCLLAGAAYCGFLMWNRNPARIFMGDCGSMLAGFTLAGLAIASPLPYTRSFVAGFFYPALTFTYPIFDTALVSLLRRLAGRPISAGGRDHSSHRLTALGLSEARVVRILWILTAAGSGIGLLVQWMPLGLIAAGSVFWLGLTLFGIFLATIPAPAEPRAPATLGLRDTGQCRPA